MANPVVGIIMGSDSDLDIFSQAAKVLDEFGVANELRVLSAHRTPDEAAEYIKGAGDRGLKIIIAGAGMSAHLAGVAAALTTLPVLAIPIKRDGQDHEALWSTVAMPPGIPLATMPENGGKNAGLMAVRILALSDPELAQKYQDFVQKQHDQVLAKDAKLQQQGWQSYLNQ
ncbi:MAG TPA: 5-(carboxyamino)imidazole ribonucleotide mutase [Candidatus Saccharimonadales bacterium]|jgi:5-(carboxyamino)imidazole ribonucleotide mutase|nr:5-(carboxyamino)imidazole ribonucleotide mutase [Candidatus Saccharimonadales bacterium]